MKLKFNLYFLLLFLTLGCDDESVDQVKDFVEKDVKSLSSALSKANIEKKVYQSIINEYSNITLQARNILIALPLWYFKIDSVDKLTIEEAIFHIKRYREKLYPLLDAISFIEQTNKNLINLRNYCTNIQGEQIKNIFDNSLFNSLIPNADFSIFVSNDANENIIHGTLNSFSFFSSSSNKSKIESIIKKVPSKLPNAQMQKQYFDESCKSASLKVNLSERHKEFEIFYSDFKKYINNLYAYYNEMNSKLNKQAVQKNFDLYSDEYGLRDALVSITNIMFNFEFTETYDVFQNRIIYLRSKEIEKANSLIELNKIRILLDLEINEWLEFMKIIKDKGVSEISYNYLAKEIYLIIDYINSKFSNKYDLLNQNIQKKGEN